MVYRNSLYIQLLNETRDDPLEEVLVLFKMNLCSTEKGMFGHQRWFRFGEVSFKSSLCNESSIQRCIFMRIFLVYH